MIIRVSFLLMFLVANVAVAHAPETTATDPARAPAPAAPVGEAQISNEGSAVIQMELRHRSAVVERARQLELETLEQKIEETKAKKREATSKDGSGKGPGAGVSGGVPSGLDNFSVGAPPGFPGFHGAGKGPSLPSIPLPAFSSEPLLVGVTGRQAIYRVSGAVVVASAGEVVDGYRVVRVEPNSVVIVNTKKPTVEIIQRLSVN